MRSFSHVALSVDRGEGPLAARLLEALGLQVTDNGPSALGDSWYTAVMDPESYAGGLQQLGFFVVPASDAQLQLEARLRELGDVREDFLAEKRRKPDSSSHVALHYGRLEDLEEAVRVIRSDGALSARVDVLRFRPITAPPAVDQRLHSSDVFADAEPVRYLTTGVQVFLQTDVVTAGLLSLGQSFELNCDVA